MARTKYTNTPVRGYTGSSANTASQASAPRRGPSDHELTMNSLRAEYKRLYKVFTDNNLDPSPFARRLYGESNVDNIRSGVAAMHNFLVVHGCMEDDPIVRRVAPDNRAEFDLASREFYEDWLRATPDRAPATKPAPARQAPAQRPNMVSGCEPAEGRFYMVGNKPFHVVKGRNGHLYARSRNPKTGQWEYQKGAIFAVRDHGRLATVEDIGAYGLASGRCFVCNRPLADPESVRTGIGPVCAKRVQGR